MTSVTQTTLQWAAPGPLRAIVGLVRLGWLLILAAGFALGTPWLAVSVLQGLDHGG